MGYNGSPYDYVIHVALFARTYLISGTGRDGTGRSRKMRVPNFRDDHGNSNLPKSRDHVNCGVPNSRDPTVTNKPGKLLQRLVCSYVVPAIHIKLRFQETYFIVSVPYLECK